MERFIKFVVGRECNPLEIAHRRSRREATEQLSAWVLSTVNTQTHANKELQKLSTSLRAVDRRLWRLSTRVLSLSIGSSTESWVCSVCQQAQGAVDNNLFLGESEIDSEFISNLNSELLVFFLRGLFVYILRGIDPILWNVNWLINKIHLPFCPKDVGNAEPH